MANVLANRAQMTVNGAPGTGNVVMLAASPGRQTFNTAIGSAGTFTIPYCIEDTASAWEIGIGSYTTSTLTLVRTTVIASSAGGTTKITATAAAIVYIAPLASDLQAGTTAGNLIQLDGSGKIPAVDGSQVTNLNGSAIASGTVPIARLPTGTTANTLVELDASARIPAVNGSLITNLSAANLTGTIATAALPTPTASTLGAVTSYAAVANQFITSLSTAGAFTSAQPAISQLSGLGANVAFALSNATNAPWSFPILDGSARYPALDGSQITNITGSGALSGPFLSAYMPSQATVSPATPTQITSLTATMDTGAYLSAARYTPLKAGKYVTWIFTEWQPVNGYGGAAYGQYWPAQGRGMIAKGGTTLFGNSCFDIVQMNGTTDYLTWYLFQSDDSIAIQCYNAVVGAIWIAT